MEKIIGDPNIQAGNQHVDGGSEVQAAGSVPLLPESCDLLPESGDFLGGSLRTSQLQRAVQQSTDQYGLVPETEPEQFSEGITGSLSVAQPLHHPHGADTEGQQARNLQQQQQQQQQQSGAPTQQQSHQPSASAAVGSCAGGLPDWDDEIDHLIREQEDMQREQQQERQQQQQEQHRPTPVPQQQQQRQQAIPSWDDDELDELLQEQEEMQQYDRQQQQQQAQQQQPRQQQQQPWGYPLDDPWDDPDIFEDMPPPAQQRQQQQQQQQQGSNAGVTGQQGRPAGQPGVGSAADAAADLDAELEDLLRESAGEQGAARATAAAAAGGGGDDELTFDDELDAMFEEGVRDGPAVPRTASQAMPPPAPKPHAIASLGVGGAAAASRKAAAAAALAALEAASKAPKQLASELTGRAITVTGMNGARVYCQLAQMPAVAAATLAYGSGSGRAHAGSRGGLLQTSIDDLLDMLADRRRQEVIAEVEAAQAAADRAQAAARDEPTDAEAEDILQQQQEQAQQQQQQEAADEAAAAAASAPRQLWVDKYSPKSFVALLSETRINREIAAWMARWNNKHQQHSSTHQPQQQQQLRKQQQQAQQPAQQQQQGGRGSAGGGGRGPGGPAAAGGRGRGRGGSSTGGSEGGRQGGIARGFDAARYKALQEARAAARVLLVVGPPGTGKTTLAHVIARHCGFRVVEVNASDARTAASLTRAVTDAAEMAPVLDGSRRRPCIVLDELDGAAGGAENHSAVAALVKLLTGEGRSKKRKRGAKGPATPSGGLSVPVICTANDAYAPCLRPLKDIAAVYHFKPPAPDKLAGRLAAIAAAEGLSLDKQALSTLVEHSGCDVRTAINTLQLLARQHAPAHPISTPSSSSSQQPGSQRRAQRVRITAADIASSGAFGVKDVSHTPMGVVQDMLASSSSRAMAARLQQLAAAMKAEQGNAAGSGRGGRRGSRGRVPQASLSAAAAARLALQEHYSTLLDLGDHEQVLSVLHESLPDLVGLDVDLATTIAAADALADADLLMASGRAGSSSSSWQYVPAPLLTVVGLVRRDTAGVGVMGSAGLNLAWPRAQAECSRSISTVHAVLRSWRASSPAHAARALGSSADGLLDLAPALRDISRPAAVRAVNAQLLSRAEERVLTHVVDALVAYGLTYTFPVEDEAEDGKQPRAAPLAPSVDTLHTYSALSQPVARFLGDKRAMKPGWAKGMPLMMRQMLAQRISTAVITRLEQARLGGERDGGQEAPTPAKAGPAARTPLGQQQPAANSKGGSAPGNSTKARGAAAKPAPLPKAPKGCWLDAARGQAAAKRKAQILAVGANKRAALGQGLKATTAAAGADEGSQDAAAAAEDAGGGHNGYTVLYKFNEGYTNAVKRPIKMAELLGLPQ